MPNIIAQLVHYKEDNTKEIYQIKAESITIGRGLDNDIALVYDKQASRRHASIEINKSGAIITDLDSTNGVFVNDKKISKQQKLASGDKIKIGDTIFRFDMLVSTDTEVTEIVTLPTSEEIRFDIIPPEAEIALISESERKERKILAEKYLAEGLLFVEKNDYESAITKLEKAISTYPDIADSSVLCELGIAYKAVGNFEQSAQKFQKAIDIDPNNAKAYDGLGEIYCHFGLFEKAIAMHNKALEIKPSYSFYLHLGFDYLQLFKLSDADSQSIDDSKFEIATKAFQSCIEISPKNYEPYIYISEIYSFWLAYRISTSGIYETKDSDLTKDQIVDIKTLLNKSRIYALKAYQLAPDNPQIKQRLEQINNDINHIVKEYKKACIAYLEEGNYTSAHKEIMEIINIIEKDEIQNVEVKRKKDESEICIEKAMELWEQNDIKSAEAEFNKAIEVNPTSPYIYYAFGGLGAIHLIQGKTKLAISEFKKALKLSLKNDKKALYLIHSGLASAYLKECKYYSAMKECKRANLFKSNDLLLAKLKSQAEKGLSNSLLDSLKWKIANVIQ